MKPKHQRLRFVIVSLAVMALGVFLLLQSFRDSLVFFYTPTQWQEKNADPAFDATRTVRIGGLVKAGSIVHGNDQTLRFVITDLQHDLAVRYRGLLPSLFREGQGVVAQGEIGPDNVLDAKTILAKHDENYMPKEVVDALKKSGRWQEGATP